MSGLVEAARAGIVLVGVALLGVAAASLAGCTDFLTDPATRFSGCLERAVREAGDDRVAIRRPCDLDPPDGYLLVLLPEGRVEVGKLRAAGLSEEQLLEVQSLRLDEGPYIMVLPLGRGHACWAGTRFHITTTQVALKPDGSPVTFELRETFQGVAVVAIE